MVMLKSMESDGSTDLPCVDNFDTTPCNIDFQLRDVKIEDNFDDKKIYSVRFCDFIPSMQHYCVSVGSNAVSVYKINEEMQKLDLIQHYIDTDINPPLPSSINHPHRDGDVAASKDKAESENFYTCTWALGIQNHVLVVAAGKRGVLKVLNTITMKACGLVGHGDLINELRTSPIDPGLVFSASKDRSVRLWNVRTMTCVAVFGGERGHRDEVLSLDIHILGNCMASSGMDTSIKIWNLKDPKLLYAIQISDDLSVVASTDKSFPVEFLQFPLYSTTQLHTDYVDCVRWVGDCLLTKSTNNRIVLWAPDAQRHKTAPLVLQEYACQHCALWFIKFEVCLPLGLFALGNTRGKVYVYPLGSDIPCVPREVDTNSEDLKDDRKRSLNVKERFQLSYYCNTTGATTLSFTKSSAVVRQTSFSADSEYMVCCLDDGSLQLWSIRCTQVFPVGEHGKN